MSLPILFFVLTSFVIGLHSATRVAGKIKNFYVAGNIIPIWVIAVSLCGQAIEVASTSSNANQTMENGFWAGAIFPVGIGVSLLLIGALYAEPLHRMRLLTLPDFYNRRYDSRRAELFFSVLCVLSFMTLLASNLAGVGILFRMVLAGDVGLSTDWWIIVTGAIIMTYTMAGGLFAVTWNDVLHVGVALLGFVAAIVWMVSTTGWDQAQTAVVERFSMAPLTSGASALPNWAALAALGLGDIVALDFMERAFAAKTPRYARVACLTSGALTIAFGVLVAFVGMIAASMTGPASGGAGVASEAPFIAFVQNTLPPGIRMMVFMGLIAACFSTADGAIMACSKVITRNVIQQNWPALVPKHRLLAFSRLTAVPITVGAIVLAIFDKDPGNLLIFAFDLVFAGCLVPLAVGVYWRRPSEKAALWAMVIPTVLRFLFHFQVIAVPAGIETVVPPALSLALFVGVGLGAAPSDAS